MSEEKIKLNDKELLKCIDELKGTQFLNAYCILDWIIKTRNENEELKEKLVLVNKMNEDNYNKYCLELKKINKAIEFINTTNSYVSNLGKDKLLEILRGNK